MKPVLVEILELVRASPDRRTDFEDAFIRILDTSSQTSLEVVIFCMHELRWESVREAAVARSEAATDLRVVDDTALVVEAFSVAWEGEDEWGYFAGKL